jgi:metallo-beta-lactamase class B
MLFRDKAARTVLRADAVGPTRRGLLALGCACCLGILPVRPAVAQSPEVAEHLAAARAAAGQDLLPWLALGQAAMPASAPSPSIEALMAQPAPPPGKACDNLAFVGARWRRSSSSGWPTLPCPTCTQQGLRLWQSPPWFQRHGFAI